MPKTQTKIVAGQLLKNLAQLPFLTGDELAVLTGLPQRNVEREMRGALDDGLIGYVQYSRSQASSFRRYYLTLSGVTHLAEIEGTTPARFMSRSLVSVEWQRSLLRRIDALDLLYQLLVEVARQTGSAPEFVWHRDGPFDAAMRLPDGKRFGIVRMGSTHSWASTRRRLGSLLYGQRKLSNPVALVIVPGEIEKRRLSAFYRDEALLMFVGAEGVLIGEGMNGSTWELAGTDLRNIRLERILTEARRIGRMPSRPRYERDSLPPQDIHDAITDVNFMAARLRPAERRLTRLLYDWPLTKNSDLATLLGISEGRLKEPRATLVRLGLVHKVGAGETATLRGQRGGRLVLSDAGLRVLAWTDRRALADLTRHWRFVTTIRDSSSEKARNGGRRVDGSKMRTLLRELNHTDAVSEIVAMLSAESRAHSNYRLVEGLPPHRWDRTFRFNDKRAVMRPDATFLLEYQGKPEVNFLEYEERASVPARMRSKVASAFKYYGARETNYDFEKMSQRTLFVFSDSGTAGRFANFVVSDGTRPIPLLVSSIDVLRETGVFGVAWTFPWQMNRGRLPLSMIRRNK